MLALLKLNLTVNVPGRKRGEGGIVSEASRRSRAVFNSEETTLGILRRRRQQLNVARVLQVQHERHAYRAESRRAEMSLVLASRGAETSSGNFGTPVSESWTAASDENLLSGS